MSRLQGRIVVDVRGQAFGDRDLLELDKLPVCEVLDAQGTDLTDAGLALMHGLKNLRCLVVRTDTRDRAKECFACNKRSPNAGFGIDKSASFLNSSSQASTERDRIQ